MFSLKSIDLLMIHILISHIGLSFWACSIILQQMEKISEQNIHMCTTQIAQIKERKVLSKIFGNSAVPLDLKGLWKPGKFQCIISLL